MQLYGYGEDSITLGLIQSNFKELLEVHLKDESSPSQCTVFYRPSFGRKGGKDSPQFGEFDMILLSHENIYLFECKWINRKIAPIKLSDVQITRHEIMKFYIEEWCRCNDDHPNWKVFVDKKSKDFKEKWGKPIIKKESILQMNLETVLNEIKNKYGHKEIKIQNILLLLSFDLNLLEEQPESNKPFKTVKININKGKFNNFIKLKV